MANEEAQQILEQLNNATVSQRQWNVASADGMSAAAQASAQAQLQRMQDAQMSQLQAQLSQQNYLRAYSNAMPGVPSPTQIYSDPTMSNYALQNMYTMNPYMANFFGQSQGAPSMMGMAPPSFQTSPRMGLFRGTRYDQQGRPVAERGLISDVAALMRRDSSTNYFNPVNWMSLGLQRTFAPHEDPIDEVIEAKRRMYRRGESLAGAGIMGADIVGALALGGPAGLALGMATLPISMGASAYFQRRAETAQIQDISRGIATGAGAGGYRNMGFSGAESARMMMGMRRDAAASPFYSMSDMTQMFEQATQNNLFAFTGNSQQTSQSFKKIVASIDTFMRLAGDPDVQSAMQRMSTLQNYGATIPQMTGVMTSMRGLANLAGTNVSQMMQTTGAYGAQVAAQMGQSPLFGMIAGGTAQAAARSMVQRGVLSPTELAIRGGEEGVTQSLTQILTNTIGTAVEQRFAGIQAGNPNATLEDSFRVMGKMNTRELMEYQRELKDRSAQYLADMTPDDQVGYLRNFVNELQGYYGKSLSRDDILRSSFGESWKTVKDTLSEKSAKDRLSQQTQAAMGNAASEEEKFSLRNAWWNRMGTAIASGWEGIVRRIGDQEGAAIEEQTEAQRAAGMESIAGYAGLQGSESQRRAYREMEGEITTAKPNTAQRLTRIKKDSGAAKAYLDAHSRRSEFSILPKDSGELGIFGRSDTGKSDDQILEELEGSGSLAKEVLSGKEMQARVAETTTSAERMGLFEKARDKSVSFWTGEKKAGESVFDIEVLRAMSPEERAAIFYEADRSAKSGIPLSADRRALVEAVKALGKGYESIGAADTGATLTQLADKRKFLQDHLGLVSGSPEEEYTRSVQDYVIEHGKGSRAEKEAAIAAILNNDPDTKEIAQQAGIPWSKVEDLRGTDDELTKDVSAMINKKGTGGIFQDFLHTRISERSKQAAISESMPMRQLDALLSNTMLPDEIRKNLNNAKKAVDDAGTDEEALKNANTGVENAVKEVKKAAGKEREEILGLTGGRTGIQETLLANSVRQQAKTNTLLEQILAKS